jgi:radical SAM protein with 4Fe4S-binding SPASM domain
VLPCSSFESGIGNLLTEGFETIWNRRSARYWRNKEFLPPVCQDCDLRRICCGACPLYWDEQQGFGELPGASKARVGFLRQARWQLKRKLLGRTKGVNLR